MGEREESRECSLLRGSVASSLISPLVGGITIVRFDVVHVSPTGLDEEKSQALTDLLTS